MLGQSYLPEWFTSRLESDDLKGTVELCNSELYRDPETVIRKLDLDDGNGESVCAISTSSKEFLKILQSNATVLGLDLNDIEKTNRSMYCVPEGIAKLVVENVQRQGERLFARHTLATIPKLDWDLLAGGTGWRAESGKLIFDDLYEEQRILPDLARRAEVPATCLSFEPTDEGGLHIYMDKRIPLIGVYTGLFYELQYDHEAQKSLVDIVNAAYDKSMESIKANVKLDYELVTLRNCAPFSRLQEHNSIDYSQDRLPYYWFDPREYVETPLAELKDSLAIEDHWYNARYIVTYEFPADAMFLRTTVEKQQTKAGGGVEYIYLQNLDKHRIRSLGNVEQLDQASTLGEIKAWETIFGKPHAGHSHTPFNVSDTQTWVLPAADSDKAMRSMSGAPLPAGWVY